MTWCGTQQSFRETALHGLIVNGLLIDRFVDSLSHIGGPDIAPHRSRYKKHVEQNGHAISVGQFTLST